MSKLMLLESLYILYWQYKWEANRLQQQGLAVALHCCRPIPKPLVQAYAPFFARYSTILCRNSTQNYNAQFIKRSLHTNQ